MTTYIHLHILYIYIYIYIYIHMYIYIYIVYKCRFPQLLYFCGFLKVGNSRSALVSSVGSISDEIWVIYVSIFPLSIFENISFIVIDHLQNIIVIHSYTYHIMTYNIYTHMYVYIYIIHIDDCISIT